MALRRCIVVWPAHLTARLVRAWQSTRPRRLMEVCSFAHGEIALLLQAAHSNYQIGAFENFHQLIKDKLIVLRPGPKVFFQYELRFVNCLKSQLLISHLFFPHQRNAVQQGRRSKKSSRLLGDIPAFFGYPINFCFNTEAPSDRSRRFRVPHRFRAPLAHSAAARLNRLGGRLQQAAPDSRAVEKDRQPSLIAVDGAVPLRVVRAGDVQFARPELGVRDGHEVVAPLHQR
jgi:hypothetical protein